MAEEQDSPPDLPVDNTLLSPQEQASVAERLQAKWLRHAEWLLDKHVITSTDFATIARVLMKNGWQFDISRLPKKLQDKLTSQVDFEDEDEGVFPIRKTAP